MYLKRALEVGKGTCMLAISLPPVECSPDCAPGATTGFVSRQPGWTRVFRTAEPSSQFSVWSAEVSTQSTVPVFDSLEQPDYLYELYPLTRNRLLSAVST